MLVIRDLSLSFGDQIIFDHIDLTITYHQKIGLVGRNGTGKSTLLKVIAQQHHIDSGSIACDKKKRIGYLAQELVMQSDKTVFDQAFAAFGDVVDIDKHVAVLELQLVNQQSNQEALLLTQRYSALLEQKESFNKASALQKTETILTGLGFSQEQCAQSVQSLSIGWRMRLALAYLLLTDADFYLFDEPTNHLDLTTKEWFLSFLRAASFGYILVSHDQYFLDHACETIIELERGKATVFNGNFSCYVREKNERQERLRKAHMQQQKEIERKQEFIDRFRAKASKASVVQSMIKQLDKIEVIELEPPMPEVQFSFPPVIRSGNVALKVDNITYAFGEHTVLNNVSFSLLRGQKGVIVAPNGTGKTTLFNVITGHYKPRNGTVTYGHNVQAAYFQQEQSQVLDGRKTILQTILDACPQVPELKIRSFLGSFLFSGDDVHKKISYLSGGEKNRVAMIIVLLQNANVLLLDEPTNHLDLYAKHVLLQALQQYQGTLLLVSHDRVFIEQLATVVFELTVEGVFTYGGDYASYMYHKKNTQEHTPKSVQQGKDDSLSMHTSAVTDQEIRKQIRMLENTIVKLEKKRNQLALQLSEHDYGSSEYIRINENLSTVIQELEQQQKEWDFLVEQM